MATGNLGAFLEPATESVKLIQTNILHQPGHDPVNATVLLVFPNMRGNHPWANLHDIPKDSAKVWSLMILDGKEYVSVKGSTDVIFAKDVTNHITGTWSGTLATAFRDTVRVSGGQFNIPLEEL